MENVMDEYQFYVSKYGEKYLMQLELEVEYKQQAEEMLKASLEKTIVDGSAGSSSIGTRLVNHTWDTCRKNIAAFVDETLNRRGGVVPVYTEAIKKLATIYREREDLETLLTLSTLITIIDGVMSNRVALSAVATEITSELLDEANIEAFCQEHEINRQRLAKNIKTRVWDSYRKTYVVNFMHKRGYNDFKWTNKERVALGAKLIECALLGSGYFEETQVNYKGKLVVGIKATDWLIATWTKNADLMSRFAYKFIPTIIPPKKWANPYGGGYYGEFQRFSNLLRQHSDSNVFVKEYRRKLATVDLSYIYECINALQETPYKINTEILDVCEQIVAGGGNLGGLPQTEPYPNLPRLLGDYTEEELKEHKKKMLGIIKRNQTRVSKALRVMIALSTARKFAKYDKIYFPWNLDYRGRCYPIPTALSPQGDDVTKALLVFSEPTPCRDAQGWKWLAIHGANLAGHDKISFEARIQWVLDNQEHIIASAENPLHYTWWSTEAENDYPMEFLSFCCEWRKLQQWTNEHGSCVGFATGLPICFDGTCSGLQHFSALLRDEIGGHAVNLTPTDKVQDIYSIVADKVNVLLTKDATSGSADDFKRDKKTGEVRKDKDGNAVVLFGTKSLAQQWIMYSRVKFGKDGITRKVCKRSVMTLAYGSGRYGFSENLLEDIIKPFTYDHPDDSIFLDQKQAAAYLAGLIWVSVSNTVVKAVEGMKYLQALARKITASGAVVTWTTPNGLPVQQTYMQMDSHVFEMRLHGHKKRLYTNEPTGNIDNRRQAQGISPNFIHSMDATHLQRVVVESKRSGNGNFAMIHDSFGTDLAHAGEMFNTIRREFVKLYDGKDYLTEFYNDVEYLIDDSGDIPERPEFGKLDLKQVLDSDFCFA